MPLTLTPLKGLPMIREGDDLASLILEALNRQDIRLESGDILVIAQKIVSKTEGRQVDLKTVTPTMEAMSLAKETNKDPRLVELILQESKNVIRKRKDVLIVESNIGLIHANAGIDQSNVEGEETALLLPFDPDASARGLKTQVDAASGADIGIVINDSVGRAWRKGTVGLAIGVAGVVALQDLKGTKDLTGRTLETTEVGLADQIAAAASLVQGQAAEGTPVVLIRGLNAKGSGSARDVLRSPAEDLFR
ncbi:MAG: coenzyme F420-0:L-glutamate ligase [Alphaproteobacteria bacterium]|nr:MAG: coenzyme F420-0:L-glutamate ligase [Alphaproteobacteria bacterium]